MKSYLFLLGSSLLIHGLHAQNRIEKFFDYNWKVCDQSGARYRSVKIKQDSLWHQQDFYVQENILQMNGYYKDSVRHGLFTFFHNNGQLSAKRLYKNNKRQGLCVSFHKNGMIRDSANYVDDVIIGKGLSWYASGKAAEIWDLDTLGMGTGIGVTYFENKQISSKGRYSAGMKKRGLWNYYHVNGKKASDIVYTNDKIVSVKCYNDEGIEQAPCDINWKAPEFPGGPEALTKYLKNKIYWPKGLKFENKDRALIIISFTVDIDGSIKDIQIELGFHEDFEIIARRAISQMPHWQPALEFNRKMPESFLQHINFVQKR